MKNGRTSLKNLNILLKEKNATCQFYLHWPKQIKWPGVGWEHPEVGEDGEVHTSQTAGNRTICHMS